MAKATLAGWGVVFITISLGCSSSNGAPSGTSGSCNLSGSFTATLAERTNNFVGCDGGVPPTSISVTVNWSSDGNGTANGESCYANCLLDGGTSGPCVPNGLPVATSGRCEVDLVCNGSLNHVAFIASGTGDPASVLVSKTDVAGGGCFDYSKGTAF